MSNYEKKNQTLCARLRGKGSIIPLVTALRPNSGSLGALELRFPAILLTFTLGLIIWLIFSTIKWWKLGWNLYTEPSTPMVTELNSILLINVEAPADTRWAARLETISQIYLTFTQSWSEACDKSNSAKTSRHFVCESCTSLQHNHVNTTNTLLPFITIHLFYLLFNIGNIFSEERSFSAQFLRPLSVEEQLLFSELHQHQSDDFSHIHTADYFLESVTQYVNYTFSV